MTVRVYRSTNIGAPVLTNVAASLGPVISLLVGGTSTASVTTATSVSTAVTVTTALAHGFTTGQYVTISGAVETAYNGEFPIVVTGATQFTYTAGSAPSGTPATGTVLYKLAGSGWTNPFSGSNLYAFRQPSGTNQWYVRLDDTGTTSARMRMYEAMSSTADAGTNPTPTDAQLSGGMFVFKNASPCPWVMVCNGPTVYLWINTGNIAGAGTTAQMTMFGDYTSYKAGDIYNSMIAGATTAALADTLAITNNAAVSTSYLNVAVAGHFGLRSHTQIGSSILLGKQMDATKTNNVAIMGTAGMGYPSPVDGGLYVTPIFLTESALGVVRGTMNGIWAPCHARPLNNGDIFTGTGTLAGKVFEAFHHNTAGQILLETSNTW